MDNQQRSDLEFHLPQGEFGCGDRQDEFEDTKGEYFPEQGGSIPPPQEDSRKRRSGHIRRMAMMLTCAASVGLVAPGLGTKAETATATEASLEAEETDIPESESPPETETPPEPEGTTAEEPTEEEMLYRLSEEQQAFISRVYQAFDGDDMDGLIELWNDAILVSLCEGEFNGMVFVEGEEEALIREGFDGKGLLFEDYGEYFSEDGSRSTGAKISLLTFVDSQAQGEGKDFTASVDTNGNQGYAGYNYFIGNFRDNMASGDGVQYKRHIGWGNGDIPDSSIVEYRYEYNDEGRGVFTNGLLTDGTGNIHLVETGADSGGGEVSRYNLDTVREEVYVNGIVTTATVRRENLNTGEQHVETETEQRPQTWFDLVEIRPY